MGKIFAHRRFLFFNKSPYMYIWRTTEQANYLWHIDGYDKLKVYGFAIHGDIDG